MMTSWMMRVTAAAGSVGLNLERAGMGSGAAGSGRMSVLSLSFEGEVYVFPAVTPEKVQAVLLLVRYQRVLLSPVHVFRWISVVRATIQSLLIFLEE